MATGPVISHGQAINPEAPVIQSAKERVAILGCGILGSLMVKGLRSSQGQQSYDVTATQRSEERAAEISRALDVNCHLDNEKACEDASIVVLAVRPQSMPDLLEKISPSIKPGTLCITIAAGLPIQFYEERFSPDVPVIRALPSPLMKLRRGLTALSAGPQTEAADVERARQLFSLLCQEAILVPERDLDLFGALFGSSAALIYRFIDAALSIERCNAELDFSARRVIAGMLDGASHMLTETTKSPRELSDEICTPNGMTAAGVNVWERNNVSAIITSAIEAALNRAAEMGRGG